MTPSILSKFKRSLISLDWLMPMLVNFSFISKIGSMIILRFIFSEARCGSFTQGDGRCYWDEESTRFEKISDS